MILWLTRDVVVLHYCIKLTLCTPTQFHIVNVELLNIAEKSMEKKLEGKRQVYNLCVCVCVMVYVVCVYVCGCYVSCRKCVVWWVWYGERGMVSVVW